MYLGKLKFSVVCERSRSTVKVTRCQKVKILTGHISKTTGLMHPNKSQNVHLVKGFPPIYLVFEFHFRSKSSPDVKRQIYIFTWGRGRGLYQLLDGDWLAHYVIFPFCLINTVKPVWSDQGRRTKNAKFGQF